MITLGLFGSGTSAAGRRPAAMRVMRFALAGVCCLISIVCEARARPESLAPAEKPGQTGNRAPLLKALACLTLGMKPVDDQPKKGVVCKPQGDNPTAKILACLSTGMEAVLVQNAGALCATPNQGGVYLDGAIVDRTANKKGYPHPRLIDAADACAHAGADGRVLDRGAVKELLREEEKSKSIKKIDPNGIRIIGGIYCDGLDLIGLDLPYSLVLDRSVFGGDNVDVRNFRTKGDLSFDIVVVYSKLQIKRAEISGSIFAQHAFVKTLEISDSNVNGSIRLDHSGVVDRVTIKNANVEGDLDINTMFFSYLEVFRNNIAGVFDLSQSQARCSFDMRKNEIGDMVATQLGFGALDDQSASEPSYLFTSVSNKESFGRPLPPGIGDPNDHFADPKSKPGVMMAASRKCAVLNSIKPGTFALVDNRIKSTLCVRSFNWLSDGEDQPRQSNIYLTENTVSGATWLDITQPKRIEFPAAPRERDKGWPIFTILNLSTGTLVLNFAVTKQDISLIVNGLNFERIYTSRARCESAMALRANRPTRPRSQASAEEVAFPPNLELPESGDIIAWINKNKFAGTQQPFEAFVKVFEHAGDGGTAKVLRIRSANIGLRNSLCGLLPATARSGLRYCAPAEEQAEGEKPKSDHSSLDRIGAAIVSGAAAIMRWVEKAIVALISAILWVLADHGYRPERIGWFVLGTLLLFWLGIFPFWLRIVGYSIDGAEKQVRLIGFVFFFDRMLPAYRLREQNYKIKKYYVTPRKGEKRGVGLLSYRNWDFLVGEANETEAARAEWWLDLLRLLGLVFAIFIIAAISRLVR